MTDSPLDLMKAWFTTPIDVELSLWKLKFRLSSLPGLSNPFGSTAPARRAFRAVGWFFIVIGGLGLGWSVANEHSDWSPIAVEVGGALVLFGVMAIVIGRQVPKKLRPVALIVVTAIGVGAVWVSIAKHLDGPWLPVVHELGIGALTFVVLEKLVAGPILRGMASLADTNNAPILIRVSPKGIVPEIQELDNTDEADGME